MDKTLKSLDHFTIKSTLVDGQIMITLEVFDSYEKSSLKKLYGNTFHEGSLPEDVKKNFQDIQNVHSILSQSPQRCKVDCQKGHITLLYEIKFPNGNKFMLEGNLVLNEKEIQKKETSKSSAEIDSKLKKMEEDIKKVQQFCYKDAKAKQEMITRISKDLIEDFRELKLKIEQVKQENKKIKDKNSELEQKQSQLKNNSQKGLSGDIIRVLDTKLQDMKLSFTDKLQKQAEKIQDLEQAQMRNKKTIQKVSQQNLQLKKVIKVLQDKIGIVAQRIIAAEQKLDSTAEQNKKMNKKISDHGNKIEEIKIAQNSPKKQPIYQPKYSQGSSNQPKFNPLQSFFADLQSPKSSQKFADKTFTVQPMQIHSDSAYSRQFVTNGKAIMYNGVSEQHTILVGALNISVQRVSFLTIVKSKRNEVAFGFIDQKNIKDRNPVKKNSIMLSASNGGLYQNGVFISADGSGFKQGEKIKMRVNPVEGFIEYSISGIVIYKHRNQRLRDQSIGWLPFIRLCDKGDTVKWTLQ